MKENYRHTNIWEKSFPNLCPMRNMPQDRWDKNFLLSSIQRTSLQGMEHGEKCLQTKNKKDRCISFSCISSGPCFFSLGALSPLPPPSCPPLPPPCYPPSKCDGQIDISVLYIYRYHSPFNTPYYCPFKHKDFRS